MEIAWAVIIAFSLLMYVALDGYDLGMGVLLLFDRDPTRRRRTLEIVATAWDGNESWIILVGVALWAGLPTAFAVILPHVYVPLIVMLFALILRGVSVEMVSAKVPKPWMSLFILGSFLAAFAQGVIIGSLTQAIHIEDATAAGGPLDVLTPFTVLTGIATVALYAALGAGYTRVKTSGGERQRAGHAGRIFTVLAGILAVVVALSVGGTAAPLILDSPLRIILFTVLAVIALAAAGVAFVSFADRGTPRPSRDRVPLFALVTATVAGFIAFAVGRYPVIVAPSLTLEQAAAPGSTLVFVLIGVGLNIPLLIFYSWFAHREFRGRGAQTPPHAGRPSGTSAFMHALSPKGIDR